MVDARAGFDVASPDAIPMLLPAFMKRLDHIEFGLVKRMTEQLSGIEIRLSHFGFAQ